MSSENTKNNSIVLICFISLIVFSCFFEVSYAINYIKFLSPPNVETKNQPKIPANPYTRGCSPLTRCRDGNLSHTPGDGT